MIIKFTNKIFGHSFTIPQSLTQEIKTLVPTRYTETTSPELAKQEFKIYKALKKINPDIVFHDLNAIVQNFGSSTEEVMYSVQYIPMG